MSEYISREVALKKLQMQLLDLEADQDKGEYSELCENRGARDALDEAIYDIRTIKAADVQPVKHGRWIDIYEYCEVHDLCPSGLEVYYWCSECDKAEKKTSDFCPNCGADMTGGAENG